MSRGDRQNFTPSDVHSKMMETRNKTHSAQNSKTATKLKNIHKDLSVPLQKQTNKEKNPKPSNQEQFFLRSRFWRDNIEIIA